MLLDRSGQGKVYNLITRRRFLQMDVLEGLNVLVTISGWFTEWTSSSSSRKGTSLRRGSVNDLHLVATLREKEQAARLLLVLAEEPNPAQRPGGGEEAGMDHSGRSGGLRAL